MKARSEAGREFVGRIPFFSKVLPLKYLALYDFKLIILSLENCPSEMP